MSNSFSAAPHLVPGCFPYYFDGWNPYMSEGKLKQFCQLAFLLVMVVAAAGAVLTLSLQVLTAKVPHTAMRVFHDSQFAYMGRGVPGGGYMNSISGSDYLADIAREGGGLHRWSQSKFPLKVFIADGSNVPNYRPSYKQIMVQAFQDWQTDTHGLVSWRQVSNPRQADIVALWTSDVTARGGGVEAGNTETITSVDRYTGNGTIQAAKISILTGLGRRPFSDEEMRKTTLHEVGHSLGLEGHSHTRSDIMYAAVNPAQTPYLRERDINTLQRLYAGAPMMDTPPTVASMPRGFSGYPTPSYGYPSPSYGYAPRGSGLRDAAWAIGQQLLRQRLGF